MGMVSLNIPCEIGSGDEAKKGPGYFSKLRGQVFILDRQSFSSIGSILLDWSISCVGLGLKALVEKNRHT
jgi:hypothetical protein